MAQVTDKIINGWKYTGQLDSEGQPHGFGVHCCIEGAHQGDEYRGMFERGSRCGLGTYRNDKSGRTSIAIFKDDKHNGVAYVVDRNGNIAHALYENDMPHGFGVWISSAGLVRIGQWVEGKLYGEAMVVYKSGEKKLEEWKEGKLTSEVSG